MMEKMNGLSLDFIIHPGETVKEVLDERGMSQEELAIRTGFSPKHVSEVVHGKKGISPAFAKTLEYVFGMPASFWINLQGIYDREIIEFQEQQGITENEFSILRKLKDVIKYCQELRIMSSDNNKEAQIMELRNILMVNKLEYIAKLPINQVAFRGSKNIDVDIYVLYAWQRICELYADSVEIEHDYDVNELIKVIPKIKEAMFLEVNDMIKELQKIFSSVGIAFQVVKNFPGAPVQGFIKKKNNRVILCMTIRQSFADIFWFTLFHEIGHLINDNVSNQYIDYTFTDSEDERRADDFARETLINEAEYQKFISQDSINEKSIEDFAKTQGVRDFIVVGRLENDKNDYKLFANKRLRYKWK